MNTFTDQTVQLIWWSSLGLFAVVTVVVAVLLELVRRTAAQILGGASAIWTHGKLVANNTIQIPLFLNVTGKVVSKIKGGAFEINGTAQAIAQHAEGCPGCPQCVLGL